MLPAAAWHGTLTYELCIGFVGVVYDALEHALDAVVHAVTRWSQEQVFIFSALQKHDLACTCRSDATPMNSICDSQAL